MHSETEQWALKITEAGELLVSDEPWERATDRLTLGKETSNSELRAIAGWLHLASLSIRVQAG